MAMKKTYLPYHDHTDSTFNASIPYQSKDKFGLASTIRRVYIQALPSENKGMSRPSHHSLVSQT